jgi:hypothetical protein
MRSMPIDENGVSCLCKPLRISDEMAAKTVDEGSALGRAPERILEIIAGHPPPPLSLLLGTHDR